MNFELIVYFGKEIKNKIKEIDPLNYIFHLILQNQHAFVFLRMFY